MKTLLEEAQSGDMFVSGITFGEEGFEVQFMFQDEQHENVAQYRQLVVIANTEDRQDAYYRLQELAQWVVEDALTEDRKERL